jgi:hypothetical protein
MLDVLLAKAGLGEPGEQGPSWQEPVCRLVDANRVDEGALFELGSEGPKNLGIHMRAGPRAKKGPSGPRKRGPLLYKEMSFG